MPLYLRETDYSGGTNLDTTLNYGQLDGNFIYLDEKFKTGPFTGSLSGSLQGTASYATTASYTISSSYALTASHVLTPVFPYTGSAIISGSLTITGSILVSGSIIPNVGSGEFTSSFNLGSATAAWKDLYVSNGTINFLDGAGAVQGTLSSTAAGLALGSSKLSGSFIVTGAIDHSPQTWLGSSAGDQLIPKYTEAFLYSNFSIQNATAFSIFSGATTINPVITTAYSFSVLPFYKKHNSYFVQNNGDATTHANFTSSLILSLPPWTNVGLAPGERVTVYNMSSGSNLLNGGNIYIGSTLQYVDSVESYNTNGYTNRVKSTTNNGSLLSGSWLDWKNINPALYSNTSHSITLNPGEKAIFELVSFPRAMDVLEAGNIYNNFSNSNYPTNGSREMDASGFDALGSTRCAYVFIAKENIS